MTAFVVHMLRERGLLDTADRVCEHIPEYDRHGKGEITIGHVLAHRSGVPYFPRDAFPDRSSDRETVLRALCDAKPIAEPGKVLAYHPFSGGAILGEIVERAASKDIRTVLAEEILEPLSFRWTTSGVAPEDVASVALDYATGPTPRPLARKVAKELGLSFEEAVAMGNGEPFLTAVVPAGTLVSTANELTRFLDIFRRGGELDGVRVMTPETVRFALTEQSHLEPDRIEGIPTRYGYGPMLGSRWLNPFGGDTQHAFGHLGFTHMIAWADPERALSCAVLINGKPVFYGFRRVLRLARRITAEAPKVPGSEMSVWDPLAGRPGDRA